MIGERGGEDLSLLLHAPESARMDDSVAISLKRIAVRMLLLGTPPASTL
jgi:hypothetical protein